MTLIFVRLGRLLRDDVIYHSFALSFTQLLCRLLCRTGEGFGNSRHDDDKDLVSNCLACTLPVLCNELRNSRHYNYVMTLYFYYVNYSVMTEQWIN